MRTFLTTIRPRYAETDQMGVVHHANYLIYMEQARIEWLTNFGFSYKKMEDDGFILPVKSAEVKYHAPLLFGEEFSVRISLENAPSVRVSFAYEFINKSGQLCATAEVVLAFTDSKSFRPKKPPVDFTKKAKKLFD